MICLSRNFEEEDAKFDRGLDYISFYYISIGLSKQSIQNQRVANKIRYTAR